MPEPAPPSNFYGYLSEPEVISRMRYSTDLNSWTSIRSSKSIGAAASPLDGVTYDACGLIDTVDNDSHYMYTSFSSAWDVGERGVFSVWLKACNKDWAFLYGSSFSIYYDLVNGAVGTATANGGATIHATGAEDWGNGWYRCWVDCTPGASTTSPFIMSAHANAVNGYAGKVNIAIFVFGPQLEIHAGGKPSSFIPVPSTAAVTRNKDQLYFKGDDGNIVDTQQGTIFADILLPASAPATTQAIIDLNDGGAAADAITLKVNTSQYLEVVTAASGGNAGSVTGSIDVVDGDKKTVKVEWQKNRVDLSLDDAAEGTPDTSVDLPDDIDRINVGNDNQEANQLSGVVSNITIYSRRGQKLTQ